jgi:hypothetical protein
LTDLTHYRSPPLSSHSLHANVPSVAAVSTVPGECVQLESRWSFCLKTVSVIMPCSRQFGRQESRQGLPPAVRAVPRRPWLNHGSVFSAWTFTQMHNPGTAHAHMKTFRRMASQSAIFVLYSCALQRHSVLRRTVVHSTDLPRSQPSPSGRLLDQPSWTLAHSLHSYLLGVW